MDAVHAKSSLQHAKVGSKRKANLLGLTPDGRTHQTDEYELVLHANGTIEQTTSEQSQKEQTQKEPTQKQEDDEEEEDKKKMERLAEARKIILDAASRINDESVKKITYAELDAYQKQYASNPARLWINNDPQLFSCIDRYTDEAVCVVPPELLLVWKETQKLGNILMERSVEALEHALFAVENSTIDLSLVDCYLPVMDLAVYSYGSCVDCLPNWDLNKVYHIQSKTTNQTIANGGLALTFDPNPNGIISATKPTAVTTKDTKPTTVTTTATTITEYMKPKVRKMSILRAWAGMGCNPNTAPLLKRLFYKVLLPCGYASRYNESFNCFGHTAFDYATHLKHYSPGPPGPSFLIDDQCILMASLPLSAQLSSAYASLKLSQQNSPNVEWLNNRLHQIHTAYQRYGELKNIIRDAIHMDTMIVSTDWVLGCVLAAPDGTVPDVPPVDAILAYLGEDASSLSSLSPSIV